MKNSITHVAMDTHKKQHAVALAWPDSSQVEQFTVKNTPAEIAKMVKRIKKQAPGQVHFCYEAGVCGFTLMRQIEALGCKCSVIAPSLVPTKPGERIKTDRRDAKKLLGQFIAGQLTQVYPPDEQQEAARDLTRCRHAAQENLKRVRQQLIKFLTRHGYIYNRGRHWTNKHFQWLRSLVFDISDLREVFDIYHTELQHCMQRLASLDRRVEELGERPESAFGGFEFGRFASPRALMSYLGLVPSESSSGDRRRHGGITKAGNKRIRRLLVESAWHYRHSSGVGKDLRRRRRGQPQWAIDIADRAIVRLRRRYWRLLERGKAPNKVVVAVARELVGFLWAMLREYELRKAQRAA